jgi:Zn-dependent M28 family amino/carboxypeptidase
MHLVLTPRQLPDAVSYNVIGDLKGSENSGQVVIASGHLDSWDLGTGAIDDGAGVAVAMQAANLVKQLGLKPRRTIRVIAWMNEENGLRGGTTYAAKHALEVANHFGAIETDGGADHPIGIYFGPRHEIKAFLQPVAQVLKASGAGNLEARDHIGADIEPLLKLGVPNFSPIQDSRFYFNYHHSSADTLDKIDPHQLAENAAINAVLAYALANLKQPLPR